MGANENWDDWFESYDEGRDAESDDDEPALTGMPRALQYTARVAFALLIVLAAVALSTRL